MRIVPTTPPGITLTGATALGSPAVTGLSSTAGLQPGQVVTGAGVPTSTLVLTVDSATQVTLTNPATASGVATLSAADEPVTVAEVVMQIRTDFPQEYPSLARMISAARAWCEVQVKQSFLTQSWRLYHDYGFPTAGGYYNPDVRRMWIGGGLGGGTPGVGFNPGMFPNASGAIEIPNPPLQSVTSVQYFDFANVLQTVDPSTYLVSLGTPARIQPQYSRIWPVSRPTIDSVLVDFVSGYGTNPDAVYAGALDTIKTAILLGVTGLYRNRGDKPGVLPEDDMRAVLSTIEHGAYA